MSSEIEIGVRDKESSSIASIDETAGVQTFIVLHFPLLLSKNIRQMALQSNGSVISVFARLT